jgi:hypothetical protein
MNSKTDLTRHVNSDREEPEIVALPQRSDPQHQTLNLKNEKDRIMAQAQIVPVYRRVG